jgi:hypothetical protein
MNVIKSIFHCTQCGRHFVHYSRRTYPYDLPRYRELLTSEAVALKLRGDKIDDVTECGECSAEEIYNPAGDTEWAGKKHAE